MGTKYTTQSATGYNSAPPADDGSTTDANKGKWSTIKTKLGDPLKTLADAINTALVTALDVSVGTTSTNTTTLTSQHQKPILCTNTITISLCDATAAGIGYQATVVNIGTGIVTVGVITASDTLNGTANGTLKLAPGQAMTFETNSTAAGYNCIGGYGPWQLLSVGTASTSSSLAFTGLTGYSAYRFEFVNILLATDAQSLLARVSTDNGSSYKSGVSDYAYANWAGDTGSGFAALSDDAAAHLQICGGSVSNANPLSGALEARGLDSTVGPKQINWKFGFISSSATQASINGSGSYIAAATAINAMTFFSSSGNITSGSIRCYGLR